MRDGTASPDDRQRHARHQPLGENHCHRLGQKGMVGDHHTLTRLFLTLTPLHTATYFGRARSRRRVPRRNTAGRQGRVARERHQAWGLIGFEKQDGDAIGVNQPESGPCVRQRTHHCRRSSRAITPHPGVFDRRDGLPGDLRHALRGEICLRRQPHPASRPIGPTVVHPPRKDDGTHEEYRQEAEPSGHPHVPSGVGGKPGTQGRSAGAGLEPRSGRDQKRPPPGVPHLSVWSGDCPSAEYRPPSCWSEYAEATP